MTKCSTNPKQTPPCNHGYYIKKNKKNEDCCYKMTKKQLLQTNKTQQDKEAKAKEAKDKEKQEKAKAKEAKDKEKQEKAKAKEAKDKEKHEKDKEKLEKIKNEVEKAKKELEKLQTIALLPAVNGQKKMSTYIFQKYLKRKKDVELAKLKDEINKKIKNSFYCKGNKTFTIEKLEDVDTKIIPKFNITLNPYAYMYITKSGLHLSNFDAIILNKKLNKKDYTYQVKYYDMSLTYNSFNKEYIEKYYDIKISDTNPVTTSESVLSSKWFKEMNDYMINLSMVDMLTVHGYTFIGDRIVNSYIRSRVNRLLLASAVWMNSPFYTEFCLYLKTMKNEDEVLNMINLNHSDIDLDVDIKILKDLYLKSKVLDVNNLTPFFEKTHTILRYVKYEHILKIIDSYKLRLRKIIENSPPLPQTMTVFRGVKDKYFAQMTKDNIYRNAGFISTSLQYNVAKSFSNHTAPDKCCIFKIKLLKGTKALLIPGVSKFPNELEFLLSDRTNFIVQSYKQNVYEPNNSTICETKSSYVLMSEMIAI